MVKKNNNKKTKKEFRLPADVLRPVNNFLQDELKKLLSKKQQVEKNDPFANPDRINDNAAEDTDAAEQFGHAQSEAIKDHLNLRIIQVRKALARVKIGKYGICENCNEFIDTKRLMTFPETTLCAKCGNKGNK
jgi:RNA polymerase-binding transcription factor DksA